MSTTICKGKDASTGVVIGSNLVGGDIQIGNGSMTGDVNILAANYFTKQTFTPTLGGSGGSTTYGVQHGFCHRIGNIVFFDIFMSWSATTLTGGATVRGLPITADVASGLYNSVTIGLFQGASKANANIGAFIDNSVPWIKLQWYYSEINNGPANLDGADFASGGEIRLSGHYIAA